MTRTGYTVTGGTRTREAFFASPRVAGYVIALWRTGNRYTIEETQDGAIVAVCGHDDRGAFTTEARARDAFEDEVSRHMAE